MTHSVIVKNYSLEEKKSKNRKSSFSKKCGNVINEKCNADKFLGDVIQESGSNEDNIDLDTVSIFCFSKKNK